MSAWNDNNRLAKIVDKTKINTHLMYNVERKLQFIEEFTKDSTDNILINYLRSFNKYGMYERKIKKDLTEFSDADFVNFFENYPWGYASFNVNKATMKNYLTWCVENNLVDNDVVRRLESITYENIPHRKYFTTYFFKSFNELQYAIDQFMEYNNKSNKKMQKSYEVVYTATTALYLAWYGVKLKDVCELKKKDFNEKSQTIFIESENRNIYIDNLIMINKIKEYIASPLLLDGDYLLRTHTKEHLPYSYLSNILSTCFGDNESNEFDDKLIQYTKVYYSGLYCRARIYEHNYGELKTSELELLGNLFQEDYSNGNNGLALMYKRLKEYRNYIHYLYNEFE